MAQNYEDEYNESLQPGDLGTAPPAAAAPPAASSAPESWQAGYDTLLKQMGAIQGKTDVYKRGSPLSADRHMQNIAKTLAKDYGITSISDIGVRYETRPAYETGSDESRTVIPEEQLPVYYNKKNPNQIISAYNNKFGSENEGDGFSEYNFQPVSDGKGGTIALPVQQYSKSGMGALAQDLGPVMSVVNIALMAEGIPPIAVAAGNVAFQAGAGNIKDFGDVLRVGAPIMAADPGIIGAAAKMYTAYQAFDSGNVLEGLASLSSVVGLNETANGLRFINAVKTGNVPAALTTLGQMSDVNSFQFKDSNGNPLVDASGKPVTLGTVKIGGENGFTLSEASKVATITSTLMSDNPNYGLALQLVGDLRNSPDTVMAGKAASLAQALSSPNPNPAALYSATLGLANTANTKVPGTAPVDNKTANAAVRVTSGETGDAGADAILSASTAVGQNLTGINNGLTVADLGTGTVSDAGGNTAVTDTSGKPKIPSIDLAVNRGVQSGSGSNIQTGYGGIVTTGAPADRLERLNTLVDQGLNRSWASQNDAPPGTPAPLGGWTVEAYLLADPFAKSNYSLPEGWRFLEPADESSSTPFTTVNIDGVRYAVTKPGLEADTSIPQSTARLPRGFPTDSTNLTGGENNSLRVSDIVGNNPLSTSGAQTGAPAGASTGIPPLTAEQITALTIADTNGLLAGDLGVTTGTPNNTSSQAAANTSSQAAANTSSQAAANTVANNLGVLTSDLGGAPGGVTGGITGGTPGGTVGGGTNLILTGTTNGTPGATTGGTNLTLDGLGGAGTTGGTPGGGPAGTTGDVTAGSGILRNTSSQVTGLNSTQIAALVTSQVTGLSSTQIAALVTSQNSGILRNTSTGGGDSGNGGGGPGGGLSTTPAGALSSALRTLNTTQIAAVTSAPVTLTSSPVVLPTTQLTSIVPALTSGPIVLPTTQLTSIVPALTSGPIVLPTSQVTSIVPALTSGLTTLTSTQITTLTSTQVPAGTTGPAVLTSSQISALVTTDPRGLQALPTSDPRFWRQTGAQGTGGKGGVRFFDWYDTPENRTMAPTTMASTNIPAITSQQAEAMVNPAKRYFNQATNRYYTDPTGQWTPPAGWAQTTFKDGGNVETKHFEEGDYVSGYVPEFDSPSYGNDLGGYKFNDFDLGIGSGYGDSLGYDFLYGDGGRDSYGSAAENIFDFDTGRDTDEYLRSLPSDNASYGGGRDQTARYQQEIRDAAITGSPNKSLSSASNIFKQLADAAKNNPKLTTALIGAGLGGLLGYLGRPKGFSPKGMQGDSLGLSQSQVHGALKGVPVKRAEGGEIGGYAGGGGLHYLKSAEDGMADKIPATIDNKQPAKLSGGEFVIPADVVSHLGNGNSEAGAKQLYAMMDRIRHARTGTKQQGKQVNPAKFTPK